MTKKSKLSERDIITKYILPAIAQSGWAQSQIREEVSFTAGRIFVQGRQTRRGKKKRADIILYYRPNIPVAVIEAKDESHPLGAGLQQALDYAETLDIPVAIASNGSGFVIQYRRNCGGSGTDGKPIVTEEADLAHFPTPGILWECYRRYNGLSTDESEQTSLASYFFGSGCHTPRYYQRIAINRTVEAIARGQERILLVMATGTGKTYTAFQIIYRLWKSGAKKRILYLADRTNLITQTKKGDFKHFKDKLTIIRNKKIDKAYEIYLALYQGLTNYNGETDAYLQFSPNFSAVSTNGLSQFVYTALSAYMPETASQTYDPWAEAWELIYDEQAKALAHQLADAGVKVPDMFGYEVEGASGAVIAEMEYAWTDLKIGFLTEDNLSCKEQLIQDGWTILTAEDETVDPAIFGGEA